MVTFAGNEFLSFYTDYVDGTNRFIVIGVQQWGYYESTRSEYDLIYPIAFVSATFCITAIGVEDGHGFAVIRSVSKTQARISNDTYTNYWIVIGMQCSGEK